MTRSVPVLALPPAARRFFAWPRGPVRPGDFTGLIDGVAVCVGDYVSRLCVQGLGPERSTIIFDGLTKREKFSPPATRGYRLVEVTNPRGAIALDAMRRVCEVVREPGWAVAVRGEEDMLALVAMQCARPGYVVVYGLPGRGAVLVRIDGIVRSEASSRLLVLKPALAPASYGL